MLNGALLFFCFRANQTPSTIRPIARKPMNPIAMTTPPFMLPPFLDIVIALIFGAGVVDLAVGFSGEIAGGRGEGGIRDVVMGEGDAIESGGGFNKNGVCEEAGGGGGGNAGEEGLVSYDFIAGGGGETEVSGVGTTIGRGGKGERVRDGGAMPKGGEGDTCGGGGDDKFIDGGGHQGVGGGGTDGRGRRDGGGKEEEGGGVDNGGGDDWGRGEGER
nr:glycine-rich protein DOT1-like [Coffea arabica]